MCKNEKIIGLFIVLIVTILMFAIIGVYVFVNYKKDNIKSQTYEKLGISYYIKINKNK